MVVSPARAAALAGALLATAGVGCGQAERDTRDEFSGESRAVASTVEDLQSAGRKGDARRICRDLLAAAVVKRMSRAGERCERVVDRQLEDADAFELSVEAVRVNGSRATARVRSTAEGEDRTDSLGLVKESGRWRIAALGQG